jgi:penicillin amidase
MSFEEKFRRCNMRGKTIVWIIGGLLGLLLIIVIFLGFSTWRSFPKVNGSLTIPGLDGVVDIYRDEFGIPQIFATTDHDIFFAQGYVHAQDRFWQMDFWRHQGAGRLSELMGEVTLETDIFLRTMGWERIARQELDRLDPEYLAVLEAYSAGVNAYLADRTGTELSLEYLFLNLLNSDYTPTEWVPLNTLTWQKAMAWDLGSGYLDLEIDRALLAKTLSPAEMNFIFPSYPSDHPVIVDYQGGGQSSINTYSAQRDYLAGIAPAMEDLSTSLAANSYLSAEGFPGIGSNSWAVSGDLTDTGKPYLANDPHLGQQIPSIWYQIGMHCVQVTPDCQINVAGYSFAGAPGVIIGHNEFIAWGFTNVGPDVIDLYVEKINPDNPDQYEFRGNWVDMETVVETINVAGSDPYLLTVKSTTHGPLITDSYGITGTLEGSQLDLPEQYAISMRWTALEPTFVFRSIFDLNLAENWDQFREAASNFAVPPQNLIYADVYGNIGYQMPGNIPIRAAGDDGKFPKPGWTGTYEWQGYIPFEELPYSFNPPEGFIVTANNAVVGPQYPYFITDDWSYGWRAQRIVDLIQSTIGPIDRARFTEMQGDNYNMIAEVVVPVLMQVDLTKVLLDPNQIDPEAVVEEQLQIANLEAARSILSGWDYQNDLDSAPAALFNAVWRHLIPATFDDQMPEFIHQDIGGKSMLMVREIIGLPNDPWWDDYNTRKTEDRDDILTAALIAAVAELEEEFGKDPLSWAWGEMHTITFSHNVMDSFPVINLLFNRGPYPASGGSSIVNATSSTSASYQVDWMPSMRMVVDLSNLSNSLSVHTTGESGHAFAGNYADMVDMWRLIEYYPMLWDRATIEANAEAHLQLGQ